MEHKEAVSLLAAYLDDEISGNQRRDLEAHVTECHLCRKELETLKRAQEIVRGVFKSKAADADPPPQAWQHLQSELGVQRPSFVFLFRKRTWRIVATILIAAVLVVLALLWATGVLPGMR